jgi:hypothetical protein
MLPPIETRANARQGICTSNLPSPLGERGEASFDPASKFTEKSTPAGAF